MCQDNIPEKPAGCQVIFMNFILNGINRVIKVAGDAGGLLVLVIMGIATPTEAAGVGDLAAEQSVLTLKIRS